VSRSDATMSGISWGANELRYPTLRWATCSPARAFPFEDALLEQRKGGGDAIQQGASGGGEGDGPWRPIEELESKLAFEPGDLLGTFR
jgi:hypothetical protein